MGDGYSASAAVGGFRANHGIAEIKSAHAHAGIDSTGARAHATGASFHLTKAAEVKLLDGGVHLNEDGVSVGASIVETHVGPAEFRLGLKAGLDKDGLHLGPVSVKKFW